MTTKQTKQSRLVAMVDEYRRLSGASAVTMDAVAGWAMEVGLYPVPGVRDPLEAHIAWDKLFSAVCALGRKEA